MKFNSKVTLKKIGPKFRMYFVKCPILDLSWPFLKLTRFYFSFLLCREDASGMELEASSR